MQDIKDSVYMLRAHSEELAELSLQKELRTVGSLNRRWHDVGIKIQAIKDRVMEIEDTILSIESEENSSGQ